MEVLIMLFCFTPQLGSQSSSSSLLRSLDSSSSTTLPSSATPSWRHGRLLLCLLLLFNLFLPRLARERDTFHIGHCSIAILIIAWLRVLVLLGHLLLLCRS